VRRNLLGLIALGFIGFAAILCLTPPLAEYRPAGLMGLRAGIVLGALWLALPDLYRLPRWSWLAVAGVVALVVFARGVLLYAFPLLAAALAVYLLYRRWQRPA